jgi:hypothetical protein
MLEKYLARTRKLADRPIEQFKNNVETDFAKRPAKQTVQNSAKLQEIRSPDPQIRDLRPYARFFG